MSLKLTSLKLPKKKASRWFVENSKFSFLGCLAKVYSVTYKGSMMELFRKNS